MLLTFANGPRFVILNFTRLSRLSHFSHGVRSSTKSVSKYQKNERRIYLGVFTDFSSTKDPLHIDIIGHFGEGICHTRD